MYENVKKHLKLRQIKCLKVHLFYQLTTCAHTSLFIFQFNFLSISGYLNFFQQNTPTLLSVFFISRRAHLLLAVAQSII